MAIYRYLPGKQALLEALIAQVFGELRVVPNTDAGWQEQVRAFAHPNLVLHLVVNDEVGASATLAANETLYTALAAARLSPRAIILAADLLVDFLNGFALGEASGQVGQPGERRALLAQLEAQPPEQHPTLRRVFSSLSEQELVADFEGELELVLLGIAALGARSYT